MLSMLSIHSGIWLDSVKVVKAGERQAAALESSFLDLTQVEEKEGT
jgi:hypothetical protein